MNKVQKETIDVIEEKLASVYATTEAISNALDRSLFQDFGSYDTTEKRFSENYKNGVSTVNIVKSALETIIKEQNTIFEMLGNLN